LQRRANVHHAQPLSQFVKPVQRHTAQRKRQPAFRPLKTQHHDDEHRAVQEQHEQRKKCGQEPEAGGAFVVHHSSLRMSTSRVSAQMIISTMLQQDHRIGRCQRKLQVRRLHLDDLADGGDLLAAHDADGDEVAHHDGDDEDGADDDAGARQRHDDVPQRLPGRGAAVVGRFDQAAVNAHHRIEDRHDHEHGVEVHEGQHHREIGEQQPLDRLVHDAQAHQALVDQAVAAQQRHPRDHADHVGRPERDRAQHEQQRLHASERT
jgi:hypothetical protein